MSINEYNWFVQKTRSPDFYTISERLGQFLRRDFSSIKLIMQELFPNSYERRLARDVPLVESIAKQHSTWYRRAPNRNWVLPSGDGLSAAQQRALANLYEALDVNFHMRQINEMAVIQGTVVGLVMPIPGTNLMQIKTFEPWEMEVDPSPLQSHDAQACAREGEFRFRIPIASTFDRVTYGKLIVSSEKATITYNGKETGIYKEDGSMPAEFNGQVPIFTCRMGSAFKGDFFAPLKTDIYDAQVSVSVAFSDLDFAARFGAWGQKVITNATQPELHNLVLGPDRVVTLMDDQKYEVVANQAQLSDYQQSQESFMRYVATHNSLNPSQFTSQGQMTAVAKMLDLHDRDAIRQDQVLALRRTEQELYNALRMMLNAGVKAESWPNARVTLDYKEQPLPENKLQMAQAARMSFEDGLSSPSRELSRQTGISLDDARAQVAANITEYNTLRGVGEGADGVSD